MNISIEQLPSDRWQEYQEIRLLALKSDPQAFASSYEEETNLSQKDWQYRIEAMWFAIADSQIVALIGLIKGDRLSNKHCAEIVSLWVRPEMRGLGIAQMLLRKLQERAKSESLRKLFLHVTANQKASNTL